MIDKRRIIFAIAAPATAIFTLSLVLPGVAFTQTPFMTEQMGPHGTLEISVHRDGQLLANMIESNLITNAGRDFISQQLGATAGLGTNGANYIALTTDATAPSATDTTLTGELSTGGLARSQGSYSHTAGTDNWSISKTFNATSSFTAVQKAGLFTAAAGGTMMAESTFSSVNLANGDTLTITWTIDLGLS